MKKNLKLLISFAIIILTMPQAIQGAEDLSTANESKLSGIQLKRVGDVTLKALEAIVTAESKKTKERGRLAIPPIATTKRVADDLFKSCPEEIMIKIFVAIVSLDHEAISKLPVVCKGWQFLIKRHKIDIFQLGICNRFLVDEEICKRFLNGRLIYKPNAANDEGKVELRIADLANPLGGTFDLSQCGDTGKYLSISTGYRKRKKAENANKVEIWFTPRFLIEKELKARIIAAYFQEIYGNWNDSAPVGIFWTWGGWGMQQGCEYLTTENMDNLSKITLYENWKKSSRYVSCFLDYEFVCNGSSEEMRSERKFHVHFMNVRHEVA